MKKLVLLLIACVSFAIASAQTAIPVNMSADQWFVSYTGSATLDTSSVGGTWSKALLVNKGVKLFHNIRVKITEVSATTQTVITLQGKVFDTDTYATIGSAITYKGTGADTTVTFSEASTATTWRYFNVLIAPANGKVKTTFLKASFKGL